jgi:hypothetical protein
MTKLTGRGFGAGFALVLAAAGAASAQAITENFDDVSLLPGAGWFIANHSDEPDPGDPGWFQGIDDPRISSHSGAGTSYAAANYQATAGLTGMETISTWLVLPERTLRNGDVLKFWTRCVTPLTTVFPDRMQVRRSVAGPSTNIGTLATEVGDFTTLLLDINPAYSLLPPTNNPPTDGYPSVWTQYVLTMSGLPAQGAGGRLAFRYFVEEAGVSGVHSNFIGVDTLEYTPVAACYANCDGSTAVPILNVNDFICFQGKYAAGDPSANCDESTAPPILNVNDFICFQGKYAAGCP